MVTKCTTSHSTITSNSKKIYNEFKNYKSPKLRSKGYCTNLMSHFFTLTQQFHSFPSFHFSFIITIMFSWLCLTSFLTLRAFQIFMGKTKLVNLRILQPLQGTLLFPKSEPFVLMNGIKKESFPCSLLQSIGSHLLKSNENSKKITYFFYKPMGVGGYQLF